MVLLAGCSDPKKASDGNFKKAIDAYLVKGRRGGLHRSRLM
jgi:hypothetical protein